MIETTDWHIKAIIFQKDHMNSLQRKIIKYTDEYNKIDSQLAFYQKQINNAIMGGKVKFDIQTYK